MPHLQVEIPNYDTRVRVCETTPDAEVAGSFSPSPVPPGSLSSTSTSASRHLSHYHHRTETRLTLLLRAIYATSL